MRAFFPSFSMTTRRLAPCATPSAEILEDRSLMDAAGPRIIPPSLTDHLLVLQLQKEQSDVGPAKEIATHLRSSVEQITTELRLDQTTAENRGIDLRSAEQGIKEAMAVHDTLEQKIAELRGALQEAINERTVQEDAATALEQEIAALTQTWEEQQAQADVTKADLDTLREEIRPLEERLTQEEATLAERQEYVRVSQATYDQSIAVRVQAEADQANAPALVENAKDAKKAAKKTLDQDSKAEKDASRKLDSAKRDLSKVERNYGRGRATEQQLDDARAAVATANDNWEKAKAKKTQSQKNYDDACVALDAAEDLKKNAPKRVENAKKAEADAKALLDQSVKARDEALTARDATFDQLSAPRAREAELQGQHDDQTAATDATRATLDGQTVAFTTQRNEIARMTVIIDDTAVKIDATIVEMRFATELIMTRTADAEAQRRAHDAAIAEVVADGLQLTQTEDALLFAETQLRTEMLEEATIGRAVDALIRRMEEEARIEVTYEPLTLALRKEGSDAWSIDVNNLPAERIVRLQREQIRWDGTRNIIVWNTIAYADIEGLTYFSSVADAPHNFPNQIVQILVEDAARKTFALHDTDFPTIAAGTSVTFTDIVKEVRHVPAGTDPTTAPEIAAAGAPSITTRLENGAVRLTVDGLPPQTTAVIRGPNVEMRDIVLPSAHGTITLPYLHAGLFIDGKYTIELLTRGAQTGTAQTLLPGGKISFEDIGRFSALDDGATETIDGAPRMQMIATQQGLTFRYQFVPAGSTLEIMETDHGNLIVDPPRSVEPLVGTQGTLVLKGHMRDCWYRFLVSGPDGAHTGLEWNMYIPDDVGLIVSDPVVSTRMMTTLPLTATTPMLWLGELGHQTISGGASYDWAGEFATRAHSITGIDAPGDEIAGAFVTLVRERMGIPPSLLPRVPLVFREAIEPKFAELYDTYAEVSGDQNADQQELRSRERAAWDAYDRDHPTATGPVSDEAYNHTVQVILEAHKDDPDGGAVPLYNYAVSVERSLTFEQIATMTSRSVAVVEAAIAEAQKGSEDQTTAEHPGQSLIDFFSYLSDTEREEVIEDYAAMAFNGFDISVGPALAALNSTDDPGTRRDNIFRSFLSVVNNCSFPELPEPTADQISNMTLKNLSHTDPCAAVRNITAAWTALGKSIDFAKARYGASLNDHSALTKYHQSIGESVTSDVATLCTDLSENIFLHVQASNENTNGKLMIFILGNAQHIGDADAGLYSEGIARAVNDGYEVLIFRVGDLFKELTGNAGVQNAFALHPEVVHQHIKNTLQDRIARRGIFATTREVKGIVVEAYSWGAGEADRLFGTQQSKEAVLGDVPLKGAAYIDGVSLGFFNAFGSSVKRKPAAEHFFNVFQKNTFTLSLPVETPVISFIPLPRPFSRGEPVHGFDIDGAENTNRDLSSSETHITIDDHWALEASDFLLNAF